MSIDPEEFKKRLEEEIKERQFQEWKKTNDPKNANKNELISLGKWVFFLAWLGGMTWFFYFK
jgi:hypothetical protein